MRDAVDAAAEWEQARQFDLGALVEEYPMPGIMPGSFKMAKGAWSIKDIPTYRLDDYMP